MYSVYVVSAPTFLHRQTDDKINEIGEHNKIPLKYHSLRPKVSRNRINDKKCLETAEN